MRFFSFIIFTILVASLSFFSLADSGKTRTFTDSKYTRQTSHTPQQRGRGEVSLVFEETGLYGVTDDESVFFTVPADSFTVSLVGARLGFESVTLSGFGFKLTGGYQRMFYTSIGVDEIEKNLIAFDLFLSYYFRKTPIKWDPYVTAGPSLLISTINQQAYASAGVGTRYFFNDEWSLKVETIAMTDTTGIFGRLTFGLGYHF